MQVHYEQLAEVTRYLETRKNVRLADKEAEFDQLATVIGRFRLMDATTQVLEIGTGMGYIPIICGLRGIPCRGLEISPQLIDHAKNLADEVGTSVDITLGNLEDTDIGANRWDIIIAASVFEHIEYWRAGLAKVYAALKPGGVFFFESTNKFSFTSGEYKGVPLYGWLPDAARYALRKKVHGEDIMKLGIDFNQFTYPLLRREFRRLGFRRVVDRVQLTDTAALTGLTKSIGEAAQKVAPLRHLILTFRETTIFICIK
jgi:2-polyprenyl-3-methyl-5-hydroxy-6-metoxy-1,4-benzoquinol methylase